VAAARDPVSHQSERQARPGRGLAAHLVAELASAAAEPQADLLGVLVPLAPLVPLVVSLPVLRQPPLPEPERVLAAPNPPPSRLAPSLLSSWALAAVRSPASL
jgi:hypothetical protein